MSHAGIQKLSDLRFIIDQDIILFDNIKFIQDETYHNMWTIDFDNDFVKSITMQEINEFLIQLLNNRSLQVSKKYPNIKATFYVWYDAQATQLRFNILSGENIALPFRCKTNILTTPLPIIQDFLKDAQAEIHPLDFQNFKILNPGDPGWDEFDNDDKEEDISNHIVNVFVITLPLSHQPHFM